MKSNSNHIMKDNTTKKPEKGVKVNRAGGLDRVGPPARESDTPITSKLSNISAPSAPTAPSEDGLPKKNKWTSLIKSRAEIYKENELARRQKLADKSRNTAKIYDRPYAIEINRSNKQAELPTGKVDTGNAQETASAKPTSSRTATFESKGAIPKLKVKVPPVEEQFQLPKKTCKEAKSPPISPISMKNRYNPLRRITQVDGQSGVSDQSEIDYNSASEYFDEDYADMSLDVSYDSEEEPANKKRKTKANPNAKTKVTQAQNASTSKQPTPAKRKGKAPPPIIIPEILSDQTKLNEIIRQQVQGNYHLKYSGKSTQIHFEQLEDHKAFKQYLNTKGTEYHTYSTAEDKQHAFVLKGLAIDITIDDISDHLEEKYNISTKEIYKMKGGYSVMYLVVTGPEITLRLLKARVKTILNVIVRWEHRVSKKIITQCHRCQLWGHATAHCHRKHKCLKCAEAHPTWNCKKPRNVPAKCANCQGDHPANNQSCPVYVRKLAEISKNQGKKPIFMRAPQPTKNAWHAGREAKQPNERETEALQPTRYEQEFPPLTAAAPAAARDGIAPEGLRELMEEYRRLNSLVDMNTMIMALRELNENLTRCKGTGERIIVFQRFYESAGKYDV